MGDFNLTRAERYILANQFRILEALYPDEAKGLSDRREALERGYAYHYEPEEIDAHGLSSEDCRHVVDILAMHRDLLFSYEALAEKGDITPVEVRFDGFDGNEETKWWSYCRYFCDLDHGRFQELDRTDDFNSHAPRLADYERMLARYQQIKSTHKGVHGSSGLVRWLTKDEIIRIVRD